MSIARLALGAGKFGAWDIGLAKYGPPEALTWDVSTARYQFNSSASAQELNMTGISFKPDGSKMYLVGYANNKVYEYDLSTSWDISTRSFVQDTSVTAAVPTSLYFKPDGTKFYVGNQAGKIEEYNLSVAWDVSTTTYNQELSLGGSFITPDLQFSTDGIYLYIIQAGTSVITEYNLSVAWDISTATFNQSFSVAAQETSPAGTFFKPDGTKMYVSGLAGDDINEYSLSTPWDISTASYVQNFSYAAQTTTFNGMFFAPDGITLVILAAGAVVYQYVLGGFDITPQSSATGLFFKPDGTKMYVAGSGNVAEYNLSSVWDISTATYSQSYSISLVSVGDLYFRSDGLKLYVTGGVGSGFETFTLREYSLSVAWDISTASAGGAFDWGPGATPSNSPTSLFFKDDGTVVYVIFQPESNAIIPFTLPTPWDVSSITGTPAGSSVVTSPRGIFFRQDGRKLYVASNSSDDISEYILTVPWDLSTKTLNQTFSVSNQGGSIQGVFFRPDGKVFYTIDDSTDKIYQYSIR